MEFMIACGSHGDGRAQGPVLVLFWFEWRNPHVWPSSWTIAERKLSAGMLADEAPSFTTISIASRARYVSPFFTDDGQVPQGAPQPKNAEAMTPGQQVPATSPCGSSATMRDSQSARSFVLPLAGVALTASFMAAAPPGHTATALCATFLRLKSRANGAGCSAVAAIRDCSACVLTTS